MMFILGTLVAWAALAQDAQEREWRVFENHAPRLLADGRVMLQSTARSEDAGEDPHWDPEVVLVRDEEVFFVDSNRIEWSYGPRATIVGRRDGEVVSSQARTLPAGALEAVEDRFGRVWFADRGRALWFDGSDWGAEDLVAERRELGLEVSPHQDPFHARVSPDGSHVFFWSEAGLGFWAVTGEEPVFTPVDPRRGLSTWIVDDLVAFEGGRVLVLPSLDWLGPEDWSVERSVPRISDEDRQVFERGAGREVTQLVERLGPEAWLELRLAWQESPRTSSFPVFRPVGRALGDFVFDFVSLVASDDGRAWFTAQDARLRSGERLATTEPDYLFHVGPDGVPRRASPALEAFRPDFVDRSGDAWRWKFSTSLDRHSGGRTLSLEDAVTGEPRRAIAFGGVDARGRVWFRPAADGIPWVAHDPSAEPDDDPPFAWEDRHEIVWGPENEELAYERVLAHVRARELDAAGEIARRFATLAWAAPGSLRRGELWGELSADLSPNLSRNAPERDDLRLARASDRLGQLDLAVEAYGAALASIEGRARDRSSLARIAADCAVRAGELGRAVEHFDEMERFGTTWVKDRARELGERVARLAEDPDDAERVLDFAEGFWMATDVPSHARQPGHAIAFLSSALERLDTTLDRGQRRQLYLDLQRYSIAHGDRAGARVWAERIVREYADEPETQAEALLAVARDADGDGDDAEALVLYRRIAADHPGTPAWFDAVVGAGALLQADGSYGEAIETYARILAVDDRAPGTSPTRSFHHASHRAAEGISACHEALGEIEEALGFARLAKTRYRFPSMCGTCASSEGARDDARIRRLEELLEDR